MTNTLMPIPEGYPAEIIGYAHPWIVQPGQDVAIKVSATSDYRHRTVRLIEGLDLDNSPLVTEEIRQVGTGDQKGRFQQANIGSYALVPSIGLQDAEQGFSVGLLFQPHLLQCAHDQTILCLVGDDSKPLCQISIGANDKINLAFGNDEGAETFTIGPQLINKQWMRLNLVVQRTTATLSLQPIAYLCQRHGSYHEEAIELPRPLVVPQSGTMTLAAIQLSAETRATDHFNGRLEDIRLAVLDSQRRDIVRLDFRLEISTDKVVDVSGFGHHGRLINSPSRAVTGHDWDGSEQDWTKTSYGYGAIHFHEDDLDDAGWDTDFTITVPADARSGAYAVEAWTSADESVKDYITFFVTPGRVRSTAKTAMVLSTFTYTAYANEHMYDESRSSCLAPSGTFVPRAADEHFRRMKRRSDLGLSLYDVHIDGSGSVFSTFKRPVLNVRPGFHHWALDRPREFSADLLMIGFLEHHSIDYEVITDHDLHYHGANILEQYSVVITGSHPEYPSIESLRAYSDFSARGGSIMYLGGNGFYWRSVPDPANPHRLEVRRGDQGVRTFGLPGPERHHSINGAQGGLWRSLGRACNYLFGVGCCGEGVGPGVPYRRTAAGQQKQYSWIFDGIDSEELIGEFGFGGGASGDEIDRWDPAHGSPQDSVVVATSTGHPDEFVLFPEDSGFQQTNITGTTTDMVRSDIVLWQTPGGGHVFSVGSMNWNNSVAWNHYINSAAKVTENVLKRFLETGRGDNKEAR